VQRAAAPLLRYGLIVRLDAVIELALSGLLFAAIPMLLWSAPAAAPTVIKCTMRAAESFAICLGEPGCY
jgi:hypothetical protein